MSTTHFLFFKEIPVQNLSSQNGHHQWTTNQDSFFSDQNNRLAFTCMGISPRGKTTLKAFWKVLFLFLRISRMSEILLFFFLRLQINILTFLAKSPLYQEMLISYLRYAFYSNYMCFSVSVFAAFILWYFDDKFFSFWAWAIFNFCHKESVLSLIK